MINSKQFLKDIETIRQTNKEMEAMISFLENSPYTVNILELSPREQKNGNYTLPNYKNPTIKQGSTIKYSPTLQIGAGGKKRTPVDGLAHELGHAETYAKGKGVDYKRRNAKLGLNQQDVDNGNKNEENAIKKENIMRKKNNEPLRNYDYYPLNKKRFSKP